ncbi:MAG: NAD-dependent succinate-semialdehyde dehydrogenase [Rhodospirillaceae bacterium]|nr:NAD-dependent succinate-semialdehyde dehydrogenase [Rhodospirillaceae bacterium]
MVQLADAGLLKTQAFVNGAWIDGDGGATVAVTDPATGQEIARVPRLGRAETRRAIDAAAAAFPAWKAKTAAERARVLRRMFKLMMAAQEDLARIMTAEQGKALTESRGEIAYAASFFEWYAEEAKRARGEVLPGFAPRQRIVIIKQPIGVTAGITPWNFPAAMITRKAAPALAAGCPIVVKPAEQTPLSALALAEIAKRAGLPDGLFSVVTGAAEDAPEIGLELTTNPIVRKVGFTGSTEVGKILMAQAAGTVKKVTLELGGNAPFLVFDDADLEAALAGAVACKFRNTGQTCISANRFLVQAGIYDAFAPRLAQAVGGLVVGNGFEDGVTTGPVIDAAGLAKIEAHVDDALAKGARVLVGGARHPLGGTFYQPTVLADVTPDMRICHEETFGPVVALVRFADEAEAIRLANDTPFGLAAYFYSRDVDRTWRVADALESGMVGINTGLISSSAIPFGGVKESGIGRYGSHQGLEEYLETKYLNFSGEF